jgi:iron complex outermembrane receptor protein
MSHYKHKLKLAALPLMVSAISSQVHAQDEEADLDKLLETVVVTAQYIEQDAQDIPIAVTALSGELLDLRGQDNTAMIGAQAPSVQLQAGPASQGNSLIAFIRGIGQQDNSPTLEPGVGIYVDDVYYNNVQGAALDLLDIDRIEISRGPQGTLAGKNSIGGSIKIYSKRPDAERDGFIEASAGNFDALKVRAGSNFTLIEDELFLRLSGRHNERDGYVTNYDFGCIYGAGNAPADCETGTLGGIESSGARAALRWEPSDTLEINFGIDYIDDDSESPASILTDVVPTVAPIAIAPPPGPMAPPPTAWPWFVVPPSPDNPAGVVLAQDASVPNPCLYIPIRNANSCQELQALAGPVIDDGYSSFTGFNNPGTGFSVEPKSTVESQNTNLNIDWEFADDMQLQSITALRTYDIFYGTDDDSSPVSLSTQTNTQEHTAFSQEFRINAIASDSISYTVGAFYQDTETEIGGRIDLTASNLDFLVDDLVETTSYAAFANVIWSISDNLEFAGGLRYSDDEKTFAFIRTNSDRIAALNGGALEPDRCPANPDFPGEGEAPFDIIPNSNCLVGGINDTPPQVFEDDRIDYRLALSWLVTDDITVYGSTATGYKAGGANSRPFFAEQIVPHDSEELTSYEIGAKMELLDNSLRVNTALFTNFYDDVIVTLFDCSSVAGPIFGNPCFLPANAGEAEVSGFELEFDWLITENLYLDGSYSFVDFEYTETNDPNNPSPQQSYTPEQTWSLGAQYDFNLDSAGKISPRVDVVYQDEMFTQIENTQNSFIDSYTIVNASLRWTSEDEKWAFALEGKNLTDEYYFFNVTDQGGTGYASANPALPRTWMATVRRNFF